MIKISTEAELKRAANPGFCYFCCQPWSDELRQNRDHVPNRAIFTKTDRTRPLILRVHERCNSVHSAEDEAIGQLVSVLHHLGGSPPRLNKLETFPVQLPGHDQPVGVIENFPLPRIVARWVRAFHSALYREPLHSYGGNVYPPFGGTDDLATKPEVAQVVPKLVSEIRRNRAVRKIDWINCYNGKCRYECFWSTLNNGKIVCVWALSLYDWEKLGRTPNYPGHTCVGLYGADRVPSGASRGTSLIVLPTGTDPLQAFDH
jgi:hypothetical protein